VSDTETVMVAVEAIILNGTYSLRVLFLFRFAAVEAFILKGNYSLLIQRTLVYLADEALIL